ncbi:MAG: response regulator transcription factor [Burkholderiaceae bacterium]|nr:response regulator transcription factor [Burkholderiaceae bacterium]
MQVQLIADDPQRAAALRARLERLGIAVAPPPGRDGTGPGAPLVLLDLGGEHRCALERLQALRQGQDPRPVLALAGGDSPEERILALDHGADDCVGADVHDAELAARLRAQARRRSVEAGRRVHCGPLTYDLHERSAFLDGQPLRLSQQELALFEALIRRPGRLVTAQALHDRLLSRRDDLSLNAVQVQVCRLRRKLRHSTVRIATVRGVGYCLETGGAPDAAAARPSAGAPSAAPAPPQPPARCGTASNALAASMRSVNGTAASFITASRKARGSS